MLFFRFSRCVGKAFSSVLLRAQCGHSAQLTDVKSDAYRDAPDLRSSGCEGRSGSRVGSLLGGRGTRMPEDTHKEGSLQRRGCFLPICLGQRVSLLRSDKSVNPRHPAPKAETFELHKLLILLKLLQ